MDFCPHKKTSQRLISGTKMPKTTTIPQQSKDGFKFHDLSICAGLGPTFYWYHVLTQIWRKNSQGRPNTDRLISKFMCFFVFLREEWKKMSMCCIFAMDFQCAPIFSEILIAKFRFRHSERRWMLVFWKKCPFHAVQEINRMVEELCEEVGGGNNLVGSTSWFSPINGTGMGQSSWLG